jgi:glycosyltransferase involved in cell wall biosynthesis
MLPSFFHTRQRPYAGTFFRDWAWALQGTGVRVGIAYVEGRSLRTLSLGALSETHFQTTAEIEAGLPTVRLIGWNTLAQWTPGGLVWARLTQHVVREYIKRYGRPDIVAAQSATWAGLGALRAHTHWGLPYVITEVNTQFGMGSIRGWPAAVSRRAFANSEAVIAISENLRTKLMQLGSARHVELIPCTVDDSYWTAPPKPRALTPFTFYAQAHMDSRKGFDMLIRAFARRFRGQAAVRLVIGGGGDKRVRDDLEGLAQTTGVQSQVSFLGAIPRDAVRQAMWAANCFVLPSHAENFGVVLIEALSTGLPVISTRCGGPEDIVNDRVGILLAPGDEQGLGEAMSTIWSTPAYNPEVIRAYARERYGYAVVGSQLRDLYCRVLSKP